MAEALTMAFAGLVFLVILALVVGAIGGLLMMAWNYGILAAFPHSGLGHLSFLHACALALALRILFGFLPSRSAKKDAD